MCQASAKQQTTHREAGGQHDRLPLVAVEVLHHVHGVQVDVGQQRVPRYRRQLALEEPKKRKRKGKKKKIKGGKKEKKKIKGGKKRKKGEGQMAAWP